MRGLSKKGLPVYGVKGFVTAWSHHWTTPHMHHARVRSGLEYDECTTINFNLSIFTSGLCQTKLMGQLAYQTRVVIKILRTGAPSYISNRIGSKSINIFRLTG